MMSSPPAVLMSTQTCKLSRCKCQEPRRGEAASSRTITSNQVQINSHDQHTKRELSRGISVAAEEELKAKSTIWAFIEKYPEAIE